MSIRVRHHVNPYRAGLLSIAPPRLDLPAGPIEVELGCADAQFLFQLASSWPENNYVGVELRRSLVDDVNRRASLSGLSRLRAVHAHINVDLAALFSGESIRRFYINFPDPWFKRAQRKRRVLTSESSHVGAELIALLQPGGELFFQSDIFDLALDAMAVLESLPGLYNIAGEWSFLRHNPYPARSLREDRVSEAGLPIWRMLYRRT
jgi:tRNA (guanine-N7-)-methyltransferase